MVKAYLLPLHIILEVCGNVNSMDDWKDKTLFAAVFLVLELDLAHMGI